MWHSQGTHPPAAVTAAAYHQRFASQPLRTDWQTILPELYRLVIYVSIVLAVRAEAATSSTHRSDRLSSHQKAGPAAVQLHVLATTKCQLPACFAATLPHNTFVPGLKLTSQSA